MPIQTFTITVPALPAAPTSLVAAAQPDGSVRLTWTDNATNETSYKVLRRTGTNVFAVLSGATALAANSTTYTDTLVNQAVTYDYQVIASNAQGDSAPSNTATVTTATVPPPAPPPPDPNTTPNLLQPGAPLYQWIDAAGDSHALADPTTVGVLLGARGLLMPPVSLIEAETPFLDGSRITGVRVPPREVDLPVLVQAAGAMALRTQLRTLAAWFDPHRGDGTLRVTSPDGSQRDLLCRYAGGLDSAADSIEQAGPDWWAVAITLRAADPYFYATAPTISRFTNQAPVPFFPFFPLRLSASSVISSATAANTGDVEAWPVWTITGPATALTLTNTTTGDSLTMNTSLGVGDSLVIDTRPGKKSVTLTSAGVATNLLGGLTATSALWSLAIGTNQLAISLAGSSVQSIVQLAYTPRFLSI